jgi:hypothetical protein
MHSLLGHPINSGRVLGAFAKLRKAAISFVVPVHLSVRLSVLMELCSYLMEFHAILYLKIFLKYVENIQVSLKSARITGTLHEDH